MTPGFTTRARAERFAAALDASRGDAPLGVDPAWLRLVDRLEAVPEVQPRPAFALALREQLLTAARSELATTRLADAATTPSAPDPLDRLRLAPGRPRGQRRLTAAVAGLALVGAGGGVAVASQSALPGETLYPVKRAIEDVRTSLEDDPSARGTRLVAQARDRLTEVAALTVDDGADPVAVERTLDDFAAQAGEAGEAKLEAYYDSGDQAELLEVRDLAADSVAVLGSLEPVVPDTALTALLRAAREVRELDSLARQACGGCGGPVVDLVPELALDPASADLGAALGLPELRAAGRPDAGRGESAGAGTPGATTPGTRTDGGRTPGAGGGTGSAQGGRQQDRQDRGGASVPIDGGSVPDVDGPLRELAEGVGRTLEGLAGGTPLGDAGDLLGGGSGQAGGSGAAGGAGGSGAGKGDGAGPKKAGRGGNGGTGGGAGGLVGEALDDVDDTLGGLLP